MSFTNSLHPNDGRGFQHELCPLHCFEFLRVECGLFDILGLKWEQFTPKNQVCLPLDFTKRMLTLMHAFRKFSCRLTDRTQQLSLIPSARHRLTSLTRIRRFGSINFGLEFHSVDPRGDLRNSDHCFTSHFDMNIWVVVRMYAYMSIDTNTPQWIPFH